LPERSRHFGWAHDLAVSIGRSEGQAKALDHVFVEVVRDEDQAGVLGHYIVLESAAQALREHCVLQVRIHIHCAHLVIGLDSQAEARLA